MSKTGSEERRGSSLGRGGSGFSVEKKKRKPFFSHQEEKKKKGETIGFRKKTPFKLERGEKPGQERKRKSNSLPLRTS